MIINHINTDPWSMSRQKIFLLTGWNQFNKQMNTQTKLEYQKRLFTIKHLEDTFCPMVNKKYFVYDSLLEQVQANLL